MPKKLKDRGKVKFPNRLRELRLAANKTYMEAAVAMHCTVAMVYLYEGGVHAPTYEWRLSLMQKFYGATLKEIYPTLFEEKKDD